MGDSNGNDGQNPNSSQCCKGHQHAQLLTDSDPHGYGDPQPPVSVDELGRAGGL